MQRRLLILSIVIGIATFVTAYILVRRQGKMAACRVQDGQG